MSTRDLVQKFLASRNARGLSRRTIDWYRDLLAPFYRLNRTLPQEPEAIEQFLGTIRVSDETRHAYYRALRAFYRWSSRRYKIPNAMEDIGQPRRRKKKPYSLTMAELGYLLLVPFSPRDRALLLLLVDTGVRLGEALALVRDDIQDGIILVNGKTGEREVPLSAEVKEQLLALGTNPIFQGLRGQLTRSGGYRIVRRAMKAAGIPARKWGPHTLRHTFGRQFYVASGDLISLQRILGHTDIKTTRIYAELDLRDVTAQHYRFTPLKSALETSQMVLWQGGK